MCGSPCLPPILGTGLSSENHTSFSLTGILRHHLSRYLGMALSYCENGVARVRLPFRAEFEEGHGVIHGGLIGLIADTAGNFAVGSVSSGSTVKTVEFKLSLLAGVQGDLLAIGELVRKGRTLAACRLEVVESSGRVVAIGLATYALQAV